MQLKSVKPSSHHDYCNKKSSVVYNLWIPGCIMSDSSRGAAAGYSPIVDMKVVLKESSLNLNSRHVLPTPLSPMSNSLKR